MLAAAAIWNDRVMPYSPTIQKPAATVPSTAPRVLAA
jgi:hypothetical protein